MAKSAESTNSLECSYGYTEAQIAAIMGARLPEVEQWMTGQTMAICDGAHCRQPHGSITYVCDVRRFFSRLPPLD